MNSIGFNNFRKFAHFPSIDLGNITFLIGGNNSGKSTIVKALLLCLDNIRIMKVSDRRPSSDTYGTYHQFSFPIFRFDANEYHDVKIKTFNRALHNEINMDAIPFLDNDNSYLIYQNLKEGKVPPFMRFRVTLGVFSFSFDIIGEDDSDSPIGKVGKIEITDNVRNIRFIANYSSYYEATMSFEILNPQFKNNVELLSKSNKFWEQREQKKVELTKEKEFGNALGANELLDEILELSKKINEVNSLLGISDFDSLDESERSKLIHGLLESTLESYVVPLDVCIDDYSELVLLNVISNFLHLADSNADFEETGKSLMFIDNEVEQLKKCRHALRNNRDLVLQSRRELELLLNNLDVQYITTHAAHQNTIYNERDKSDYLAQTVHAFYREHILEGEIEFRFVTDYMQQFGIGKSFRIDSIDGEAYRVCVIEADDKETPLADKGIGAIQLMMLFLRTATIIRRNKGAMLPSFIVIEEPEQNLHPSVQCKLADFFVDVANRNCIFVVETHSEYIVRRAQVIVSKSNYKDKEDLNANNPFKVYYIPSDDSERYEMKFLPDGRFENGFRTGFFDVSSELAFELF